MLRQLLVISVFTATAACDLGNHPQTSSTAMLKKIEALMDGEKLDYAVAKQFLGIPMSTSKFEAIASGNEIISRFGDYGVKRGSANPPEFTLIDFDMVWEKESGRPSIHAWHKEKGLRSSLRLGFDIDKICITEDMLENELGSGREGGLTHGDAITISYGELGDFLVSFTFYRPGCADEVDIVANDPAAKWPTPADVSAADAEFVTRLSLDQSGKQLFPLGFHCGLETAKGSPEFVCGCDREQQTSTGPCHHAVELTTLPGGELEMEVFPLLNEEAS